MYACLVIHCVSHLADEVNWHHGEQYFPRPLDVAASEEEEEASGSEFEADDDEASEEEEEASEEEDDSDSEDGGGKAKRKRGGAGGGNKVRQDKQCLPRHPPRCRPSFLHCQRRSFNVAPLSARG